MLSAVTASERDDPLPRHALHDPPDVAVVRDLRQEEGERGDDQDRAAEAEQHPLREPARHCSTDRRVAEEDRIVPMRRGEASAWSSGLAGGIAGTVYGTIVVMATVTAGSTPGNRRTPGGSPSWSRDRARPLDRARVRPCSRGEPRAPPAARPGRARLRRSARAVHSRGRRGPGRGARAGGLRRSRQQTAVWLALGIGVVTLGVQGRALCDRRAAWPGGSGSDRAQRAPGACDRRPQSVLASGRTRR